MITKKIIGALTALTLTGAIGGIGITANAQPIKNTPIKMETNLNQQQGNIQIHFKKSSVKTLTKQETQELLKTNKNIKQFATTQEAEAYINNMKKEITENINKHTTGNEFYYQGQGVQSQSEGAYTVELVAPYAVSWSNSLGNYYSSNNGGRVGVVLNGFTLGANLSNTYGSSSIINNYGTLVANGGGDLNISIIGNGIGQIYSTAFTINGQWNVPDHF